MPPVFNLDAGIACAKHKAIGGNIQVEESGCRERGGKIGIYNPIQRKILLAKFAEKRQRRRWGKKVRYNCRKNLADTRVRVKGRFVKRAAQGAE
jgi:hypothetical protein